MTTSEQKEARAEEAECRRWARASFAWAATMTVWSLICGATAGYYATAERTGFVIIWTVNFIIGLVATGSASRAGFSLLNTANFWRERGGR